MTPGIIEGRYETADDATTARQAEVQQMRAELDDIGTEGWRRIAAWGNRPDGKGDRLLKELEVKICDDCTVETFRRKLPEAKVEIAYKVLGRVYLEAPELLDTPEPAPDEPAEAPPPARSFLSATTT